MLCLTFVGCSTTQHRFYLDADGFLYGPFYENQLAPVIVDDVILMVRAPRRGEIKVMDQLKNTLVDVSFQDAPLSSVVQTLMDEQRKLWRESGTNIIPISVVSGKWWCKDKHDPFAKNLKVEMLPESLPKFTYQAVRTSLFTVLKDLTINMDLRMGIIISGDGVLLIIHDRQMHD